MLTRDNAHAEEVFDALTGADVPVEIVGLSGLLRLPEVAEVVATLTLLHDVTANASLLTLLTGPRWAIGPRDLRLLAQRAAELAGRPRSQAEAADGRRPAAPDRRRHRPGRGARARRRRSRTPATAPYSSEARERFALLAAELRMLRAHVGEPLLDVVRRIIDTTGVDVELASAVAPAAAARRDNLDLFVKAVAEFQAVDGDVTLPALLAYLTAEDDQGNGLDVATPTAADSVKLLTVHRAKGLEWYVGLPRRRGGDPLPEQPLAHPLDVLSRGAAGAAARRRAPTCRSSPGYDKAALDAYRAATKAHDAEEELRLGYVAFTRAAHHLVGHVVPVGPARDARSGPRDYQRVIRDQLEEWGEHVEQLARQARPKGRPTPTPTTTRPDPGR